MRKPSSAMIVALLGVFLGLGGVGVAATGGNFILGQSNSAGATTGLKSGVKTGPTLDLANTGGRAAARFTSDSNVQPFTVSNSTKIGNLNADRLDGIDSTGFMQGTGKSNSAILVRTPDSGTPHQLMTVPGGLGALNTVCASGTPEQATLQLTQPSSSPLDVAGLSSSPDSTGSFSLVLTGNNSTTLQFSADNQTATALSAFVHVSLESGASPLATLLLSIMFDGSSCVFRASVLQNG
jgi:hypothetical protein